MNEGESEEENDSNPDIYASTSAYQASIAEISSLNNGESEL